MKWNEIYKNDIVEENLVSGIHLVELLERDSNYHTGEKNYFSRIKESLSYLPSKYHDAALAVFSNVVYIPKQLLDQTFSFFWDSFLLEKNSNNSWNNDLSSCHFFEVDPSGMINRFCHENSIQQRLHPDYFVRILDVYNIMERLYSLLHPNDFIIQDSKNTLFNLSQKDNWIILTDKALSGQSLFKDVERFFFLRKLFSKWHNRKPEITIFAQIITEDALEFGDAILKNEDNCSLKYGILFDKTMKVNSITCQLFNIPEMTNKVQELCQWFAENILDLDKKNFDRMRQKSGDNLAFGYKNCGLTLVDHANCPTNSIPLLWYNNLDYYMEQKISPYRSPFPRVHSRLGNQIKETTEELWAYIINNETKILEILKSEI